MTLQPTPAVSVVIATYNYGRYLAGAIDSVLAQTFADFEVVVVDDGSTDQTPEVIRRYLEDSRIRYLRHEHLGQPRTKNAGIRAARGRYVAFLDADDRWLPSKLEKQVALFEVDPNPQIGVVYSRRGWIDDQDRPIHRGERTPLRGDVLAPLFHRPFVCFSSSMVRRSVLDEVGLFDETTQYSIDYDLWLRIALKYHFDFVDEPLILYRTGHANMSSRQHERVWCVRRILYRFLDEYGGRGRLDPELVDLTLAEHCCDVAAAAGQGRPIFALAWYLRALGKRPVHAQAWRALASCWIPARARAFGRGTARRLFASMDTSRSKQSVAN
ncbi:glycosyltransferase family 2 protein [Tautonia marina]|uniref:glycosyltransferase family 2 protein n=1 Tax=Tautonia marina TaxID=2653855 RepID=UPI0012609A0D|nr:glycosyltransferase [Tautonia marina]